MFGSKFIIASFNIDTHRTVHIIAIYKPPSLSLTKKLSTVQKLILKSPIFYLIIVLRDFNVDVLQKKTLEVKHLLKFMSINKMELQFQETQQYMVHNTQLNHIWSNNPSEQCVLGTKEVFWTYHKPIQFAFKLPNHVPRFPCL
jgi:hypothetical protein